MDVPYAQEDGMPQAESCSFREVIVIPKSQYTDCKAAAAANGSLLVNGTRFFKSKVVVLTTNVTLATEQWHETKAFTHLKNETLRYYIPRNF